jgi:DNA processing protein
MTLVPAPPMGPVTLSDNTQAVLLLTSPLLASGSEGADGAKVLSTREYAQLAISLLQQRHQPADLLNGSRDALLASAPADLEPARLQHLLSRGFQLGQAIEHWANRSITVIGRADDAYPRRYKQRLKHLAPPLLYACGNLELLNQSALAVVGSRATPESLLQQTEQVGALAAAAGVVIVSGAAKGVDEAAMLGAVQSGGSAIGVVADSLEKMSAKPIWRQALLDGRLLLLSAEAPSARFQVWRAMARNKLIYALADAALVMSSAKGSGGTWEGAEEQLTKLRCCTVHVVEDPRGGDGLAALHAIGANLWPYPTTAETLKAVLAAEPVITDQAPVSLHQHASAPQPVVVQESLLMPSEAAADASKEQCKEELLNPTKPTNDDQFTPIDSRSNCVASIQSATPAEQILTLANQCLLDALDQPKTEEDLAKLLNITKAQIKQWCKGLIEQGLIRKKTNPIRYIKC